MVSYSTYFEDTNESNALVTLEERPDLDEVEPILKKLFSTNSEKYGNHVPIYMELYDYTLMLYKVSAQKSLENTKDPSIFYLAPVLAI